MQSYSMQSHSWKDGTRSANQRFSASKRLKAAYSVLMMIFIVLGLYSPPGLSGLVSGFSTFFRRYREGC